MKMTFSLAYAHPIVHRRQKRGSVCVRMRSALVASRTPEYVVVGMRKEILASCFNVKEEAWSRCLTNPSESLFTSCVSLRYLHSLRALCFLGKSRPLEVIYVTIYAYLHICRNSTTFLSIRQIGRRCVVRQSEL